VHDRDGEDKVIVTNHRVAIDMPWANPSGSPWTTLRNTWICLSAEDAAARAAWHSQNPHREYEEWWHACAYGDDVFGRAHGRSDADLRKLYDSHCSKMRDIGWEYKSETTQLTTDITDLEILGRNLYAYVQDGKVLGFVGVRPEAKLWLSLVYPKEAVTAKGVNPASVRAARLIMLCDEAAFYPRHWQMATEMFALNQKTFMVKPEFRDKYYDPMFNISYESVQAPRSWHDSITLHLGVTIARPVASTRAARDSDEEDVSDTELDDFGGVIPAAAAAPKLPVKEPKKLPKSKKPDADSEESGTDV
jgi:hypothetical protein